MLKKIRSIFFKRDVKKYQPENLYFPYSRDEMRAVSFFQNFEGEQYGKGSFNLHLYRRLVDTKNEY